MTIGCAHDPWATCDACLPGLAALPDSCCPRVDPFRDIRAVNGRCGTIAAGQGVAGPPLTGCAA